MDAIVILAETGCVYILRQSSQLNTHPVRALYLTQQLKVVIGGGKHW